jgi:hypothetical protein
MELLVVQGDEKPSGGFSNTLDLRGWKIEWTYDKNIPTEPDAFGEGVITFSQDPLWAAVPRGALITFNEWQKVWYHDAGTDPWGYGGLQRDGGINGLGIEEGDPFDPIVHELRDFGTNTGWNPLANGGGANGDWTMQVWAGELAPDQTYKYFDFSGFIVSDTNTFDIGTPDGGLYALNNDNWQWTIKDASDNVIQGPLGEALSSGVWSVGSDEIFRLENFPTTVNPTVESYLGVKNGDYRDGSSSAFGVPNIWSSGAFTQGLDALRNWFTPGGDVNLDGTVDGADLLAWQRSVGKNSGASWTEGDLNGDGAVDGADLTILRSHLASAVAPAASAVPEPGAALAFALAVCFGAALRRLS